MVDKGSKIAFIDDGLVQIFMQIFIVGILKCLNSTSKTVNIYYDVMGISGLLMVGKASHLHNTLAID